MKRTNKQKRVLTKVTLKTAVNGYLLDVNGEGYMYFNEQTLVEGFCIHVGQERTGAMETVAIHKMVEATIDGSAIKMLQQKVEELKLERTKLKKELKELRKKYAANGRM